jgi:F-type H+-transporting ATPase subunit b
VESFAPAVGVAREIMELLPDYTILIQIVAFIVLWSVLKRLVFDPIMDVLDARNERTVAARAHAEQLLAAAESARSEYEQSLLRTRARMAQEAGAARNAAQEEANRALNETREAANEELRHMRAEVQGQIEAARRTLATQADALAEEMVGRVTKGAQA